MLPLQPLLTNLALTVWEIDHEQALAMPPDSGNNKLWSQMDEVLCGRNFPELKEVIFIWISDDVFRKVLLKLPMSRKNITLRANSSGL